MTYSKLYSCLMRAIVGLLIWACSSSTNAAPSKPTPTLAHKSTSSKRIVTEFISRQNGVRYRTTVLLPDDYTTGTAPHPVIYVLDGDWLAAWIKSAAYLRDDPIVVGIDSDDADHHWQDFPTAGHDRHWDVRPERGAANFLILFCRR